MMREGFFFFFKQKTAYEITEGDWSSDVCSSDLGFGAAAGVLMGGVLTSALSWSWIFFVNVPIGVTAFILTPILLRESRDASVKSFDALGAVLVTTGLSSFVYAITQAGEGGWL